MLTLDLNLLESCSLKKLVVSDDSFYGNTKVKNASMEITPPGFNKINVTFVPDSVNIYNSTLLGISCDYVNLPDGLYKFKYSIYPNTNNFIEKSFLRTEQLQCKYGNFLLSLHLDCKCENPSKNLSKLKNIKTLIEGAIAASNDCNTTLAYELYNAANCQLDKLKKCKC